MQLIDFKRTKANIADFGEDPGYLTYTPVMNGIVMFMKFPLLFFKGGVG